MTTSDKQIAANKQNAKLGGVKTREGKEVSKLNSTKHGLLSKAVLLESEDEQSFEDLSIRLNARLEPQGEVEFLLVDRIVANIWRLKRLLGVEKATMEWEFEEEMSHPWIFEKGREHGVKEAQRKMLVNEDIEKLMRYETTIERSIYKALHELERIQLRRRGEAPQAPMAVDVDVAGDLD